MDKLEAENEGEEELLIEVVDAVGALVKHQPAFLSHFATTFYPLCQELMNDRKYGPVEHRLALCVFDDFIEHGIFCLLTELWLPLKILGIPQSLCTPTNIAMLALEPPIIVCTHPLLLIEGEITFLALALSFRKSYCLHQFR